MKFSHTITHRKTVIWRHACSSFSIPTKSTHAYCNGWKWSRPGWPIHPAGCRAPRRPGPVHLFFFPQEIVGHAWETETPPLKESRDFLCFPDSIISWHVVNLNHFTEYVLVQRKTFITHLEVQWDSVRWFMNSFCYLFR